MRILRVMTIARLAPFGRALFALSLIGFGIEQFLFCDFVPGRAPAWPAGLPGRAGWAYLTGALFIVCGVAILLGRRVRAAAMPVAALIFVWAFARQVPVALHDTGYG